MHNMKIIRLVLKFGLQCIHGDIDCIIYMYDCIYMTLYMLSSRKVIMAVHVVCCSYTTDNIMIDH